MFSKVEDFLKDDGFINYVLGVAPETTSRWETFLDQHPEQTENIKEAKSVLLAPANVECAVSMPECNELKDKIDNSIKRLLEEL